MHKNIILILMSVVVALLLSEAILRVFHIGYYRGIILDGGNLIDYNYRGLYQYSPDLGWVPASGIQQDKWGVKVTTLKDGVRSNGRASTGFKLDILAVGDSYTFGDEVADHLTWPALLEQTLKQGVINAGVSSYGLDQIVLRAKSLALKYKPKTIIVSIIYEDLQRCAQYVRHGVPKPYFVFEDNQLVLKSPPAQFDIKPAKDWFKHIFAHSQVCMLVMGKLFPTYWWANTNLDVRAHQVDVFKIAQMLLYDMDRFAKAQGLQLIVVAQASENLSSKHIEAMDVLFKTLQQASISAEMVNMLPMMMDLKNKNPEEFHSLFIQQSLNHHMTPKGNAVVANVIAQIINHD